MATRSETGRESAGERIHRLRRRKGMSQGTLAGLAGISVSALSKYERDERDPQGHVLGYIAIALRTTTDYLLGLTDDPRVPDPGPDSTSRVWLNPALAAA